MANERDRTDEEPNGDAADSETPRPGEVTGGDEAKYDEASPDGTAEGSSSEFKRIVFYSLLTGVCPLIPIPFLDDWARDTLRKRLTYELSERHGVALGSAETSILATGETEITVKGCLKGCFAVAIIKPIIKIVIKLLQKVFRKILFFLTLKDCVDTFSHTFHESYLISHALCCHAVEGSKDGCRATRKAVEEVTKEVDPRPVEKLAGQAFRGSRQVLMQASRVLGKMMAKRRSEEQLQDRPQGVAEPLDVGEEEAMLGSIVDRLVRSLSSEQGYLEALRNRMDEKLASRDEVA